MLNNKSILVTGGTGSFGKAFTKYVLQHFDPKKIIIFSREDSYIVRTIIRSGSA